MTKKTETPHADITAPNVRPTASVFSNQYVHFGLFIVLTIFVFWSFLFSDQVLSSSDQLANVDAKQVLIESLKENGELPTWFPSRLGGMPSLDAMFGDSMYLPSLFLYYTLPLHRALGMRMVVHVLLAGIFCYLMLRRGFKLCAPVAFVGAAFYMLNPEFVSHVNPGHDGKMYVIAWLPFLVWRLKMLLDAPSLLNTSLMGFGIAMCLFTSHTQMTYFALWGLFFYWVLWVVLARKDGAHVETLVLPSAYFWIAVFLGLGLAFVQFFPSFMFIRDAYSVRGVGRGFDYAASWSLHWPEFFSLWIPEFGGYLETYWSENPFKLNTEYAGAMVIPFAAMAVIYRPRPWRMFWAVLAVFASFYALGAHTPVFHIAYAIAPGVRKFRACSMMMFWFSFPLVLLTALFLNDVVSGDFLQMDEAKKQKWRKGLLVAVAGCTAIALLFSAKGFARAFMQSVADISADPRKMKVLEYNLDNHFGAGLWIWWTCVMAAVGALWLTLCNKASKHIFLAVVLIVGLSDTFRVNSKFVRVEGKRKHFFVDRTLDELRRKMKNDPFRCFALPRTLPQNWAGIHGLEALGGFHDNELKWYRAFRGDQSNSHYLHGLVEETPQGQPYLAKTSNNFLNLANARYLLSVQNGRIVKLENPKALGRISFATTWKVMEEEEILEALRQNMYDITTTVALHEEPIEKPSPPPVYDLLETGNQPLFSVSWQEYKTNYRKAHATCGSDGFVRISEVYYPGWKILVDGEEKQVYRSDGAWMAVYVNQGEHSIEMIPESVYLSKASMVSWPLIVVLMLFWAWKIFLRYRHREKGDMPSNHN